VSHGYVVLKFDVDTVRVHIHFSIATAVQKDENY
jgi:hypothetical protein